MWSLTSLRTKRIRSFKKISLVTPKAFSTASVISGSRRCSPLSPPWYQKRTPQRLGAQTDNRQGDLKQHQAKLTLLRASPQRPDERKSAKLLACRIVAYAQYSIWYCTTKDDLV